MHNFRKCLISAVCFLLIFVFVSAFFIVPYPDSETLFYQDAALRRELAGNLDFLIVGASHGLQAFIPETLDEILGCNSYNLSHPMMTLGSKEWILSKELARNPVETVVLELSNDTLSRDETLEYALGDDPMIGRADSWLERFDFIFQKVTLYDILNIYSREILHGLKYWMYTVSGHDISAVDYGAKGFWATETDDVCMAAEIAAQEHNSRKYSVSFSDVNVEKLINLVALCHQYNTRVIIVVVPLSDTAIWKYDGLDSFLTWCQDFCDENNCEFYDFNLLKNRYSLFSDKTSFQDTNHLSKPGAQNFTAVFADVIQKADAGEDISQYFYKSYEDMKGDSPYMEYLS